jgi:hypothetical protein
MIQKNITESFKKTLLNHSKKGYTIVQQKIEFVLKDTWSELCRV